MDKKSDDLWYWYLTVEKRDSFPAEYERDFNAYQRIYRLFPGKPRCFECDIPLSGAAILILRPWGTRPSSFSQRFYSNCESFASSREAGAEVELTMLFADVRGSTPLAEKTGTSEFKEVIRRFYKRTSGVLVAHKCHGSSADGRSDQRPVCAPLCRQGACQGGSARGAGTIARH
jgi:hypothetical protein